MTTDPSISPAEQSFESFSAAVGFLREDPDLAKAIDRWGFPEFWTRPPGFDALVWFVAEQQVSLASGRAVVERLRHRIEEITPDSVLACGPDQLRACGFTRQKSGYVRALAERIDSGAFDLDGLAKLDDRTAYAILIAQPGVGPWTAGVYLIACLLRPDEWPSHDRALQVGAAEILRLTTPPTARQLEEIGDRWRPHRSTAARIIWHSYLASRGRTN